MMILYTYRIHLININIPTFFRISLYKTTDNLKFSREHCTSELNKELNKPNIVNAVLSILCFLYGYVSFSQVLLLFLRLILVRECKSFFRRALVAILISDKKLLPSISSPYGPRYLEAILLLLYQLPTNLSMDCIGAAANFR